MRILVLSNLFPPHHAGSFDLRCQWVADALQKRGHLLRVLTSNHGVGVEQRDAEIERRLVLAGVFGHPPVTKYRELVGLEQRNHAVLKDAVSAFLPEVIYVWSLHGLSKSLIFGLRDLRLPAVYDVADDWLASGIQQDPWLGWWNRPAAPLLSGVWRRLLELAGQRSHIDASAPTRMMEGYDRMPDVYGPAEAAEQPNSITSFKFERLFFCSHSLKAKCARAGFQVEHGEVIYPGIRTEVFVNPARTGGSIKKLLVVGALTSASGVMTALEALRLVRQAGVKVTLSIYGRGESDYVAQIRSFVVTHQLPVEFLTVSNLNRDLAAVYAQHDVFLHTSEWDEPFALAPLEAMASGLPVIGAKAGGIQEVFRHRENAFTYTPGDAQELAVRIQELELQPALRQQMAETGQTEVLARFNESVVVDQIETFLETSRQYWQLS